MPCAALPALPPAGGGSRSHRARSAVLVELLGDESPAVHVPVRRQLETLGRRAVPALRRATRSPVARRRARARSVLAGLERRRVLRRILGYALRPDLDLERGLFLLARLDRADLDARPYRKALDAMGEEVRARMTAAPDGFAAPLALAHYLGNELGYIGSESDFSHPDNIHLHRVIERKRGMPVTLVAIYVLVARRAGIEVAPLALPGRVLLRLYAGKRSLILDPFQGGRARTRTDCAQFIARHGLVPRPQWFRDAPDSVLFQRHLMNLVASHQSRDLDREADEVQEIVAAMNRARLRRGARRPRP